MKRFLQILEKRLGGRRRMFEWVSNELSIALVDGMLPVQPVAVHQKLGIL